MSEHPCAVAACCSPAKAGQLMCLTCWCRTPRVLQNAVNRAWRNVAADAPAYRAACAAAARWHAENPPRPRQPRRSPRTSENVARLAAHLGAKS